MIPPNIYPEDPPSALPVRAGLKPADFSHRCSPGERQQRVLPRLFACFRTLRFQPLHLLLMLLHGISYPGIDHGLCENAVLRRIRCSLEGQRQKRPRLAMQFLGAVKI